MKFVRANPKAAASHRPIRRRRAGYTLAEALVAVTIFAVTIVATAEILKISVDTTGQAQANNEIIGRVNLLQSRITQDLEAMPPDAFMAFNFHYEGPFRVIANANDLRKIYTRADRMVYYTAATTSGANSSVFYTDANGIRRPVTGRLARVFLGHADPDVDRRPRDANDTPQSGVDDVAPLAREWWWGKTNHALGKDRPVVDRLLARRVTVLAPGYAVQAVTDPTLLFPEADVIPVAMPSTSELDLTAEHDRFDYSLEPLAFWENRPLADYRGVFLSEAYGASWIRRPTVTPPNFDRTIDPTNPITDPIGLHMLMMDGVAEFKVQVWVEKNDPDFLSVQDIEDAIPAFSLGILPPEPLLDDSDIPDPEAHKVDGLSRIKVENVVYGSSQFPRWYPEEDFRKDDDQLAEMQNRPSWHKDNDFWRFTIDPIPANFPRGLGRAFMGFGLYMGGPADTSSGTPPTLTQRPIDYIDGTVGFVANRNYFGLTKRPRAVKITVRMFDRNNRFANGQEHSFVVELPRAN
jgi:type II secretory pathway pseudopilin PulG